MSRAVTFELLALSAGILLIFMGLSGSVLGRLPLSTAVVYFVAGLLLGPGALDVIAIDPIDQAGILEHLTEVVVLIWLFSAGLKLRAPISDPLWGVPVRLAVVSMALTVGMVAVIGHYLAGLSWGAAVLLGAVLAPTDAVLASDVQVSDVRDRDRLRFGLTGEAGLNDGTAFPMVMLGLGLLDIHDLGPGGIRWWTVDLAWAVIGGLAIGAILGVATARVTLYLRRRHRQALGRDEFLGLGLVAISYSVALLTSTYGFLAVFAAALAMRGVERQEVGGDEDSVDMVSDGDEEAAVHPHHAPAYLVHSVLGFNEQIERIAEVAVVVLLGALFVRTEFIPLEAVWFAPLLFFGVRPLAVTIGLLGTGLRPSERALIGWFGVRGIGSLYYLAYALHAGFGDHGDAVLVVGLVLTSVAASIVVHGVTVTPLMNRYRRRSERVLAPASRPTEAEP